MSEPKTQYTPKDYELSKKEILEAYRALQVENEKLRNDPETAALSVAERTRLEQLEKQTKLMGNRIKARLHTSWPGVSYEKTWYHLKSEAKDPVTNEIVQTDGEISVTVPPIVERETRKIIKGAYTRTLHFEKGVCATNDREVAMAYRNQAHWCNIHQHEPNFEI